MPETTPRGSFLIVGDEVELMRALCEALSEQGFHAVGVTGAAAALAEIHEGEFNVMLSDLMMPGTDGIQLLKQALAIDPDLVGIIMTGQGTIPTAVEAMKSGAFDYILKPFRMQQLLPVLDAPCRCRRDCTTPGGPPRGRKRGRRRLRGGAPAPGGAAPAARARRGPCRPASPRRSTRSRRRSPGL
jgi:DNA-binding NtrC family response regulator